jgi:uridine kinase
VLVRTGYGGRDQRWPARPDFEFFDLSEAVGFIVDRHAPALEQARRSLPTCAAGSLLTIGGLARSGKSSWASLFCEVLAERGQRGVVLPLETWLRSRTDREPGDVLDRFDVEAITAAVKRLQGRRHACVELTLGHYDRFSGERDESGLTISIEPEDIVLFEGVPALAIEALVAASSASFYVECSETVRRGRFDREYQGRGLSKTETEALYLEREADEHPLIKRGASVADVRIGVGP